MNIRGLASFSLFFAASLAGAQSTQSVVAQLPGKYMHSEGTAALVVTSDTITARRGPLTISAAYRVVSVSGHTVSVELSAPNIQSGAASITVFKQGLRIESFVFGGDWVRK